MRSRLLPLIVLAPLCLSCTTQTGPAEARPAAPIAGARLPAVQIEDLQKKARSLESVRAGRVALVSLWATWCEACVKEMPALNRLDERATGDLAVVIGVAVGEPVATVRGFVEKHGLRYAQVVDEGFQLTDALGQKRLPTTLVVSREGEVVFVGGALDAEALSAFRAALDKD